MPAQKRATNSATAPAKRKATAAAGKKSPVAAKAAPKTAAKTADKPAAKAAASKAATKSTQSNSAAPATKAAKTPAKAAASKATKAPPAKAADDKKVAPKTMKAQKSSNAPDNKSAFDKKFLDEQRELLLKERAKYVHHAQLYKDEADALVSEREPGDVQFDEESGEGDTLAVERDFDLALSAQARAQVDEIDAALERLDNGTYGLCRVSGKPIPKERLQAIPWATERVEYKVGGLGRR